MEGERERERMTRKKMTNVTRSDFAHQHGSDGSNTVEKKCVVKLTSFKIPNGKTTAFLLWMSL